MTTHNRMRAPDFYVFAIVVNGFMFAFTLHTMPLLLLLLSWAMFTDHMGNWSGPLLVRCQAAAITAREGTQRR